MKTKKTERPQALDDDQIKVLVDEILGTGDLRVLQAFLILIENMAAHGASEQVLNARKWAFVYFADSEFSIISNALRPITERFLTTGRVEKGGVA